MMDEQELITAWRQAAIEPMTPDQAEIELRRRMDDNARQAAEFWACHRGNKQIATRGELDHVTFVVAKEVALWSQLTQRVAAKADADRQAEIERLRNYAVCLEARITQLENIIRPKLVAASEG
jgi:hypothetical protein